MEISKTEFGKVKIIQYHIYCIFYQLFKIVVCKALIVLYTWFCRYIYSLFKEVLIEIDTAADECSFEITPIQTEFVWTEQDNFQPLFGRVEW